MRKTGTKTFQTTEGEVEITLKQLDGIQGPRLIVKLAQQHGAAIGKLSAVFNAPAGAQAEGVAEAIAAISDGLSPDDFEGLLLTLTRGGQAKVNGEFADLSKSLIASIFTGFPMGTFELVGLGLKTNYEDFFGAVAKLIPSKPKTAAAKMAQPQTTGG